MFGWRFCCFFVGGGDGVTWNYQIQIRKCIFKKKIVLREMDVKHREILSDLLLRCLFMEDTASI